MSEHSGPSLPLRVLLKAILNIGLVWGMNAYLDQYFQVGGGTAAYVIIGSLLTLMNMFLRPVLDLLMFPLKLIAMILAIIIVNGVYIQVAVVIAQRMDPNIVTLEIFGGLWGWIVVATVFGIGNWLIKEILKARES